MVGNQAVSAESPHKSKAAGTGDRMKISTKGRYALRLMYELACHADEGYLNIRAIAQRQQISEKYLEQIIAMLSRGGCVISSRGAQGGYRLAKPPEAYTVGMILRLTEGCLAPVPCMQEGCAPCERAEGCPTQFVWEALDNAISGVIDRITLAEIVAHARGEAQQQ